MKKLTPIMIAFIALTTTKTLLAQEIFPKTFCDITQSPCWGDGSECNIHFKNHIGLATGDSHGAYNQKSFAVTISL